MLFFTRVFFSSLLPGDFVHGKLGGEICLSESCIRAIVCRLFGKTTDPENQEYLQVTPLRNRICSFLVKITHRLQHILLIEILQHIVVLGEVSRNSTVFLPLAKLTVSRYLLTFRQFLIFD